MVSETYCPMAPANSVPRIRRRYHYEHFPQPSDSVEFMQDLRRGLRAVPKGGFWSKVKSAAWQFMNGAIKPPLRRPDFPVAPPSSPVPRTRSRISPDIHIYPVGSPDFLPSPPLPQEDGFLFVPARSSRSTRLRRHERLPPSPRPLPTPPGPPACPIPKILCCPWENSPSTSSSSSSSSSANSDKSPEEIEEARFFDEITPFLFLPDKNSSDDDDKSQDLATPGSSTVALSSDKVAPAPQPEENAMAMSSAQTEEIRETAVDREFLEELGLTPQTFMVLLDGVDVEWDEDSDSDED